MIHYTCDRCKRAIDPELHVRYEVRLEIQAVIDSADDSPEDDRDHLNELDDLLQRVEEADDSLCEELYQRRRYDLCSDCYEQFQRDPLAVEPQIHVSFSDN